MADLITDFIDEKAFAQFERLKKDLKDSQDEFSILVKNVSSLNNELGKSKSLGDVSATLENVAKATQKVTTAEKEQEAITSKLAAAQQQVVQATKARIDAAAMDDSALRKVSGSLDEQIKRQIQLKAELKLLKEEQKELTKAVISSEKSKQAVTNKTIELTREESLLKQQITETNLEIRRRVKEEIAAQGSSDQLSARLDQLRGAYRSLSIEERGSAEIGGVLLTQIAKLDQELKALDASQGIYNRNVGNYASATDDLSSSLGSLFPSIDKLKKSFDESKNAIQGTYNVLNDYINGKYDQAKAETAAATATNASSKSLKLLKVALISTGIGAIVVLLGSLISYLTSTQEGIDKVTSVTRPLQAIFKSLIGVAQNLGKALFETFTNPKKALTDLVDFIVNNVINRFKALGVILEAIQNRDFKGLRNGILQAVTGVEDLEDKLNGAAKSVGDFFSEAAEKGKQIDQITKDIEKSEIELIKNQGRLNRLIEEEREKSQDASLSASERAEASQKAVKAINELAEMQLSIQDKRIEKMKIEQSMTDSTIADQKELAELEAERENISANAAKSRLRLTARLNSANKENSDALKQQAANEEAANKRILELALRKLEVEEKAADKASQNYKKAAQDEAESFDERLDNVLLYVDKREEAIESLIAREQAIQKEGLKEVAKLEREGRIAEANALSEIIEINLKETYSKEAELRRQLQEEASQMQIGIIKDNLSEEEKARLNSIEQSAQNERVALAQALAEGKIRREDYEKEKLDISRRYNDAVIANEIESIQKIIDARSAAGLNTKSEEEKLAQFRIEQSKIAADAQIKDLERVLEQQKKIDEARKELSKELFEFGVEMFNAQFEQEQMKVEKDREDLEYDIELKKNAVEQEIIGEDKKRIRLAEIENSAIVRRRKLEEKERQIQIRQAKFNRAVGIMEIVVNTARGVTAALPVIPLAIAVGALGAVQLATALSKPLPKFFKGTDSSPEGFAHVGEKGAELMIDPKGNVGLTPAKDTITYLQKGTQIIDAQKTRQILENNLVDVPNSPVLGFDVEKLIRSGNKNAEDIKKAISSRPEHRTILTKRGLRNVYKNGATWNNYKNSLLN